MMCRICRSSTAKRSRQKYLVILHQQYPLSGSPMPARKIRICTFRSAQAYGGRLFLADTRFGDVIVERVKDRTGASSRYAGRWRAQTTKNLGRFLLGWTGTFESLYTFKIDSLLSLKKTQKEDLNHYLLSIGTSGSERLPQLAKEYRDEAAKRFKPTGAVPPLNKKIQDAEKSKEASASKSEKCDL